jgi:hypothetical protein
MTAPTQPAGTIAITEQAPMLLGHLAGFVAHRTVAVGLRSGLIKMLADAPDGLSADRLGDHLDLDPWYVAVWCRSAFGAGILNRAGDRYVLAPHIGTLLLDTTSPAYVGGVFLVLEQREVFDRFEASLASGERLWWDECSPEWIASVSGTGTPFSPDWSRAGWRRCQV